MIINNVELIFFLKEIKCMLQFSGLELSPQEEDIIKYLKNYSLPIYIEFG